MPDNLNTPTASHAQVKRNGQRLTKEERATAQQKFLDSFKLNANITAACQQAAINRSTFYQWLEHDVGFSVSYRQAELQANDMLLAAAWRRGVSGVERRVISLGRIVYEETPLLDKNGKQVVDGHGKPVMQSTGKPLMEREYSDSVLLRLMSWRIPGFREKSQEQADAHDSSGAKDALLAKLAHSPIIQGASQNEE